MKKKPQGFIALMSAVVISAILLVVAVTGGLTGFLERSNNVNTELKERSASTADACVDYAFLQIEKDASYAGLTVLSLNPLDTCRVVVSGVSPKVIRVQATSSKAAVTNLDIRYVATTSQVVSWQEVPVY
jgi:hypothetical protein